MEIAIIILNWNGKRLLEKFLPSILFHSEEASIYIADNASTDNSKEFIQENYPSVRWIQNKQNGGYAKGYNEALQHICADIYLLVNSDIEVTNNWLPPILNEFKINPNTAAVQPKILDFKNKDSFEYAGAAGGFIDKYGYPYCRGRIFDSIEKDHGQYDDSMDIFWASGACLAIRAKVFHELGGFDESYFAHQEEIDLCWRIHNKGYTIKYNSCSVVYHVGGATLNKANPKKTFLNFRNSLFNLYKNLPKNKVFLIIFTRLVLDFFAALYFLFQGKPMHFIAVIKSHFSFYYYVITKKVKRGTTLIPDKKYYHSNSIIKQYFIKGIKKFNEIKL